MTKEEEYIKGFNAGYWLSKSDPELLKKILKFNNKDKEYFKGVEHGKLQQQKEALSAKLKISTKSKEQDLER